MAGSAVEALRVAKESLEKLAEGFSAGISSNKNAKEDCEELHKTYAESKGEIQTNIDFAAQLMRALNPGAATSGAPKKKARVKAASKPKDASLDDPTADGN